MESQCDVDEETGYYIDDATRDPIPPDRLVRLNNKCVDINTLYEYNKGKNQFTDPYTRQPLDVATRLRLAEYARGLQSKRRTIDRALQGIIPRFDLSKQERLEYDILQKRRAYDVGLSRRDRLQNAKDKQIRIINALKSDDDSNLNEVERQIVTRRRRIRDAVKGKIPLEILSEDEQRAVERYMKMIEKYRLSDSRIVNEEESEEEEHRRSRSPSPDRRMISRVDDRKEEREERQRQIAASRNSRRAEEMRSRRSRSPQREMTRSEIRRAEGMRPKRSPSLQREMTGSIIQLNREQHELDRELNEINRKQRELELRKSQLMMQQSRLEMSRLEMSRMEDRNRDYSSSESEEY